MSMLLSVKIFLGIFGFIFLWQDVSFAGAAVQAQQQRKHRPTPQQLQQQKATLHQRQSAEQQVQHQREILRRMQDTNPNRAEDPWYSPEASELGQKEHPLEANLGFAPPPSPKQTHPSNSPKPSVQKTPQKAAAKTADYLPAGVLGSQQKDGTFSAESALSREDLNRLIDIFDQTSVSWPKLQGPQIKVSLVAQYIIFYKQANIHIRRQPEYYAAFIDQFSANSPEMLNNPLDRVLMIAAVMEYDFDNGQNKDLLARKVLGERVYLSNRKRLGIGK